ncbi:DUF2306 domain-containing protein [Porticoccaceae bacterium]|jgi:uncharacterized membrane protein|uniref:DUF2306 domain-containing protein n=1 Tax=SAR92 clade bacterium TaxID=2315479 RepID=A0A520MFZ0_9GAMM|nr:DUF2306 domain-containing protein [Porticoccaceae bacterium]MDA7589276.1 DUF2306 domain-containing protein [Porticoccaceae bacterium]MDC0370972.1 DUF2306 domain-containing protein [Porticoccaceae bacterium]MDG1322223.1 DUF2306 domain-containing protein [Porticoccaceae bacterium]RZO20125.1 MAG: DUF2306 domain-containing protein [SAR92 clade bacterium]
MTYMQLTYLHLGSLVPAFVIGSYLLLNRKGTPVHKFLGKIYMGLMLFTAFITLFMEALVGPKFLNHFGFLHLLSLFVLYTVPTAYRAIRVGNIKLHKRKMVGLYVGALLVAGAFTLSPGRLIHTWLFG